MVLFSAYKHYYTENHICSCRSRLYSQFLTMNCFIIFFTSLALATADATNDKHYIVYMGHHAHPDSESVIRANQKVIASAQGSSHKVVHHYSKSFQGFSAMLTPQQAHRLSEMDNVVSVFESRVYEIHTTHSWEFLGLGPNTQIGYGDAVSDVVVGVVDTGFWPESKSYNDKGLTAVPEKFKGECVTGENFTLSHCNRKVIGARYYYKGFEAEMGPLESFGQTFFKSARDGDGHGTHTTSTIAGSEVVGASLFGLAMGTARGGAPSARLAVYKACWFNLCSEADVLAAMDDAVSDGVDILSLSLGPAPPQPAYFSNAISIGGFHAFQKDIVVSCSAGNSFFSGTVTNAAPWILTVAASTLDREFNSDVYLGNSKVLKGYSLNPFKMKTSYRLIDGSAAAATGVTAQNASFCKNNTLDPSLVKGKIVVCSIEGLTSDNRREKALFVRDAGGVGIIIIDPIAKDVGFQISIPATLLAPKEGAKLQEYLATEKYPTGMIAPTFMALQTKPAPSMAIFSSAGPNAVSPDIIKPDITAPGANILAAWSPVATLSTSGRAVDYNIISGTSMACPHVSAVAAILRAAYPSWSASAIKSAIMTTGTTFDNTKKLIGINPNGIEATPFNYGSGHVNPVSALDPGLVYDFDSKDVISFLCNTGSRPAELRNLTGKPVDCPESLLPPYDFNYPSISVSNMTGPLSVHRTVTYYGQGPTVYNAYVDSPTGVKLSVIPTQLKFIATGEKLSFKIDFVPYEVSRGSFVFGSLTWRNGVHRVRSPIGVNVVSI